MKLALPRFEISTRRKLASILLAVTIFAFLAGLASLARGRSLVFGSFDALIVGSGIGIFEEFYVQTSHGEWMRSIHPLFSMLVYATVVVLVFVLATHLTHFFLYRFYHTQVPYGRLPFLLLIYITLSLIGIIVMRTLHFIGIQNLFHLMIGSYHRPVVEEKVILFLDINGSTRLAEQMGALQTRSMVGKFLSDVSKAITDYGGEIYLYKGDGLIALWKWHEAVRDGQILRAIDAAFSAVAREEAQYRRLFGIVPMFRIGVHGGDVVVSEQGDTKRAIGIYGSTINIAAGMEEAAKTHNVACVISDAVAKALGKHRNRLSPIGHEKVKGISVEVPVFEYRSDVVLRHQS